MSTFFSTPGFALAHPNGSSAEDLTTAEDRPFEAAARAFTDWLRLRALPVWCAFGQDESGAFAEQLTLTGRPDPCSRRGRVQARQIHVFAEAGLSGWGGPWRRAAGDGLKRLDAAYVRPDGLIRTLLDDEGGPLDETAMLYDQAFVLLALATATRAGVAGEHRLRAAQMRDRLLAGAPPAGGLMENGDHPWQSNAHMHLLEACLAWEAAGGDPEWNALADRIVRLATTHFIDGEAGYVREFFTADWRPAAGENGRRIEPGHQFEWAWLLARYGQARGVTEPLVVAEGLYRAGLDGVDPLRGAAIDAVNTDGATVDGRARLWPQTEWFKAALVMADIGDPGLRTRRLTEAADALRAIGSYLSPDGLWRDRQGSDGGFLPGPVPASSLYHILSAWRQLADSHGATDPAVANLT